MKINKEKLQSVVEKLTMEVLKELEPESLDISGGMIAPLFTEVFRGQIVAVNNNEHAGGFGGGDLLVYTVVPLIYQRLLDHDRSENKGRALARRLVGQTRSSRARRCIDQLTSRVDAVVEGFQFTEENF